MNPSSRGPVYTMDSGYSGNREFFLKTNRSPVHTKHRIRPPEALAHNSGKNCLFFFLEFYSSKRILENLGNFRGKIDKFENFRAIWAFTWHFGNISRLNVDKTFFFCIPTDQERAQSAQMLQQCLKHGLLSTTNQRLFIRVVYTTTYQRLFTKRGPRYQKKAEIFWEFFGEFQWIFLSEGFAIL